MNYLHLVGFFIHYHEENEVGHGLEPYFDWLDKRLWKVVGTSVIQNALASGVVSSYSPISSDVTKLRPWRGRMFGGGEAQAVCTIVAPPLGV